MSGSVVADPAVGPGPSDYVVTLPHLAHVEHHLGLREVRTRDELLDALAAKSAEQFSDLGGPDQMVHVRDHRLETTSHLTRGQGKRQTSHVTSLPRGTLAALRRTETRHHALGKTCWHFDYHGITCDEYDAMQARAGECCEICGISGGDTPRGSLVIDHFSSPSRRASFVRGLLCDKCNNGVMACLDGLRPWGANRRWQAKAREYEANSWQRPSELALIELSLRVEISHHALAGHVSMASRYMSAAKNDPRYRAALEAARAADPAKQVRPSVVRVRLDRGEKAIAAQLQRHLTAAECKQLGKLLSQNSQGSTR